MTDPVTAFGLFVLGLFRRPHTARPEQPAPLAAPADPLAELRRALTAEIHRQDRETHRG